MKTLRLGAFLLLSAAAIAQDILPPGQKPEPPGVHALVGGRVVVKPGEAIENATIVIRDGIIVAVGAQAEVPADARVWDMKGRTIYAGFIDAHLAEAGERKEEKKHEGLRAGLAPFVGVPGDEKDRGLPGPSYSNPLITPEKRMALEYEPDHKRLEEMWEMGFTAANVAPEIGIIRGTSVFVLLSDVDPNRAVLKGDVFQHVCLDPDVAKGPPEEDLTAAARVKHPSGITREGYPESVMGAIAAVRQAWFDQAHYATIQSSYAKDPKGKKRPEYDPALEALGRKLPVEFEATYALMVDESAHVARELGIEPVYLASGQEWRRPDLAAAAGGTFIVPVNFPQMERLPDDDDWSQVHLDHLRAWDWAPENPAVLRRQKIDVALTTFRLGEKKEFHHRVIAAIDRGLSEEDALAALTTIPAKICGLADRLGTIEVGKIANLTVTGEKGYFAPKMRVHEVWIDGRRWEPKPGKKRDEDLDKEKKEEKKKEEEKEDEKRKIASTRVARAPMEERGPIESPQAVLVKSATVWTCGAAGTIEGADVLCVGGALQAVGKDLQPPNADTKVIDAKGKHVTPGIIDCHSHSFIIGGVNEGTVPSSAMVRIGDVINSEGDEIYQQLAGGVTCAHELHGSANPIGGQLCLVKLRYGASPDGMKFADAIHGIKFALGENVKQSNWGEKFTARFPQSRMGVQTFFANRFTAAQRYLREWEKYEKEGGDPPRRDLELEALGEVLQGKMLIHCHSYRQDEILMLIRTMESFGVRIGTFQHVLEGYKVADEIAAHGAGGSCFSDWWAYKFEVYDAIPYDGSLMAERGVCVSFNSDSSELARRLYLEAAKAVKYGGTPEVEALKFVTLNPAKQLRVDARVGSLEAGKDADFVIWSESPLSSHTVCEQTWIDGKKYFDRSLDAARNEARQKERAALIEKAKKLASEEKKEGEKKGEKDKRFFEDSREHEGYDWQEGCQGRHRMGEEE